MHMESNAFLYTNSVELSIKATVGERQTPFYVLNDLSMTIFLWYTFHKHLHLTKLKGNHEKKNYTS